MGVKITFLGGTGKPPAADTVLTESTYGDSEHPKDDVLAELAPALSKLAKRGAHFAAGFSGQSYGGAQHPLV